MIGLAAIARQPIAGELLPTSGGLAPIAEFVATPIFGNVPMVVQFTDQSTNMPTSWFWKFGDGQTSTLQSPSHTYANPGQYTVSLTATNAAGSNTLTLFNYITVATLSEPQKVIQGDKGTGPKRIRRKRQKQAALAETYRRQDIDIAVAMFFLGR